MGASDTLDTLDTLGIPDNLRAKIDGIKKILDSAAATRSPLATEQIEILTSEISSLDESLNQQLTSIIEKRSLEPVVNRLLLSLVCKYLIFTG